MRENPLLSPLSLGTLQETLRRQVRVRPQVCKPSLPVSSVSSMPSYVLHFRPLCSPGWGDPSTPPEPIARAQPLRAPPGGAACQVGAKRTTHLCSLPSSPLWFLANCIRYDRFFVCKPSLKAGSQHLPLSGCILCSLMSFCPDSSLPFAHKVFQPIHALTEHLLCAEGVG